MRGKLVSREKNLPDSFEPGEKKPNEGGIDMQTTRNVKWAAKVGSYAYGNPTVADGKLYFGNKKYLFVMAAGKKPKVLSEIRLGNPVYSTPIAANGVLYVAANRYIWAVKVNP